MGLLKFTKGDIGKQFAVPVKIKGTGAPADLTGYIMLLMVKKNISQPDNLAVIDLESDSVDIETATGHFTLEFANTNNLPGTYKYDIKIFNPTTGHGETVDYGDCIIDFTVRHKWPVVDPPS